MVIVFVKIKKMFRKGGVIMIYIKDDDLSQQLITQFLQEHKYNLTNINFGNDMGIEGDNVYVYAREKNGILKGVAGLLSDGGFRSVGLFAMLDIADEYTINERLFIVNDFEFYSVYDLDDQVSFTIEWREYLAKNLPEEKKPFYAKDLETFTKQNEFENI